MELSGKQVLVFGAGISGVGAARLLLEASANVILYDGNTALAEEELRAKLPGGALQVALGELGEERIRGLDLAVLSPGVPTDLPLVQKLRDAGVRVWGEVELAWACGRGDVLAVTGTNGKTTTTSLLGEIMKAWRPEVYVVGTIGGDGGGDQQLPAGDDRDVRAPR